MSRDFSSVVSDLTPAQMDALKQEFKTSHASFAEKAKGLVPGIDGEAIDVIQTEFANWPHLREEAE